MTALNNQRMRDFERWTYKSFLLAAGTKAWKHGIAVLRAGKVYPGNASDGLFIGVFNENIDATLGDRPVHVNLGVEIEVEWFANDGSIAADDIGDVAHVIDDQTLGLAGTGALAGRIWAVDAIRGVAVQKLYVPPAA